MQLRRRVTRGAYVRRSVTRSVVPRVGSKRSVIFSIYQGSGSGRVYLSLDESGSRVFTGNSCFVKLS